MTAATARQKTLVLPSNRAYIIQDIGPLAGREIVDSMFTRVEF